MNHSLPTSSMASVPKAPGDELTIRKKGAVDTAAKGKTKRFPTAVVSTASKRIRQAFEQPTIRSSSLTDVSRFLTAAGVLETVCWFASQTVEKKVRVNLDQMKK
jgi:hypothetical protein